MDRTNNEAFNKKKLIFGPSSTFSILFDCPFWDHAILKEIRGSAEIVYKTNDMGTILICKKGTSVERVRPDKIKSLSRYFNGKSKPPTKMVHQEDVLRVVFSSLGIFFDELLQNKPCGIDTAVLRNISKYVVPKIEVFSPKNNFMNLLNKMLEDCQYTDDEIFSNYFFSKIEKQRKRSSESQI